MKNLDKSTLLFELLIGSDMERVNEKIDQIRMSEAYYRVACTIPTLANTQLLEDVLERFQRLDLYGIMTMKRAIEVEKEVIELDRRIGLLPTVNPYLADGGERCYAVKTVGDVGVEISAQGMRFDDFASYRGILSKHRTKMVKLKAFNWYKQAKRSLMEMIDDSHMILQRIQNSKIRIRALGFEYYFLTIVMIGIVGFTLFAPQNEVYRQGLASFRRGTAYTLAFYLAILSYLVVALLHTHYKTYCFRIASGLRRTIIKQQKISETLNRVSETFERDLIKLTKSPRKVTTSLKKVAVIGKERHYNRSELIDYMYSEKEYYIEHHRFWLVVYNLAFAGAMLSSVSIIVSKILGLI